MGQTSLMRPSANRHVLAQLRAILGKNAIPLEQWRLAKMAGVSVETIRRIEKGRLKLSVDLAETISRATGVQAEGLLANDLQAPLLARSGNPYTKFHFDAWESVKTARLDGRQIDLTPDYLLSYYTRLRGVMASAGRKGEQQWLLAFRRLDAAVTAMREEFGTIMAYDDGQDGPRFATYELPLIEHDVRAAREHFEAQGIGLDPLPTEESMKNYRNFRLSQELVTEEEHEFPARKSRKAASAVKATTNPKVTRARAVAAINEQLRRDGHVDSQGKLLDKTVPKSARRAAKPARGERGNCG